MVGFVPKEMFFTKGVGKHREKLTSFELALRSAGIAACNLVRVSSIFPPGCRILSRAQGAKRLEPGQVTFVVMSEAATREPHRLIAATVGVAIPRNRDLYGYLSEHHSFGESEDIAGDYAEELAAEMLATTLGLEFDPDANEIRLRNPRLPAFLNAVFLRNLRLGKSSVDLVLRRDDGNVALQVVRKEGSIRVSAVYT